jgi:hypothetical protein
MAPLTPWCRSKVGQLPDRHLHGRRVALEPGRGTRGLFRIIGSRRGPIRELPGSSRVARRPPGAVNRVRKTLVNAGRPGRSYRSKRPGFGTTGRAKVRVGVIVLLDYFLFADPTGLNFLTSGWASMWSSQLHFQLARILMYPPALPTSQTRCFRHHPGPWQRRHTTSSAGSRWRPAATSLPWSSRRRFWPIFAPLSKRSLKEANCWRQSHFFWERRR